MTDFSTPTPRGVESTSVGRELGSLPVGTIIEFDTNAGNAAGGARIRGTIKPRPPYFGPFGAFVGTDDPNYSEVGITVVRERRAVQVIQPAPFYDTTTGAGLAALPIGTVIEYGDPHRVRGTVIERASHLGPYGAYVQNDGDLIDVVRENQNVVVIDPATEGSNMSTENTESTTSAKREIVVGEEVKAVKAIRVENGEWPYNAKDFKEGEVVGEVVRVNINTLRVKWREGDRLCETTIHKDKLIAATENYRPLGTPPEGMISPEDPRLAWLWDDAEKMADRLGLCGDYNRMTDALGIPGRLKDHTVSVTVNGLKVSGTFKTRSKREARAKLREKLAEAQLDPKIEDNEED